MIDGVIYFVFFILAIAFIGKWVVSALVRISKFLGWKEFVVAFVAISFGAAMPELLIGVNSALKGVPILSLGNIMGQNLILFTLAPAICAFILKNLELESKTVRAGSTFAVIAAFLPLLLALDGEISRIDGIVLILSFFIYIAWLFSKKERFTKVYEGESDLSEKSEKNFVSVATNFLIVAGGLFLLILSSQGVINFALSFSDLLRIPLPLVGILIIGLGTSLPETYFAITLARKKQSWMILGGLMGSVAVSSTWILGLVSFIRPIRITDFSPLAITRIFLIAGALFFLFFIRTHKRITIKEGLFLFILYIIFLLIEIFAK